MDYLSTMDPIVFYFTKNSKLKLWKGEIV